MKEAFNVEEVYWLAPNLVMLTDKTTLFVFEGTINVSNSNSSILSNFQVSTDTKSAGGLNF